MKRESLVFFLGIAIILTPFLGVPNAWKQALFVLLGSACAIIGYQLRRARFLQMHEDREDEKLPRAVDIEQIEEQVKQVEQSVREAVLSEVSAIETPEAARKRSRRTRTKSA